MPCSSKNRSNAHVNMNHLHKTCLKNIYSWYPDPLVQVYTKDRRECRPYQLLPHCCFVTSLLFPLSVLLEGISQSFITLLHPASILLFSLFRKQFSNLGAYNARISQGHSLFSVATSEASLCYSLSLGPILH